MLPFKGNKTAEAETAIPPCPCHEGANVSVLGNVNGGTLRNQSCYLTANVTTTAVIFVEGTVNVCLNGFRLKCTGDAVVFAIHSGATLNLFDCGNDESHKNYYIKDVEALYNFTDDVTDTYLTGGVICGGTKGVVKSVNPGGTFNMYGGNLAGNRDRENANRGTVDVTNFNMYAGKICGNIGRHSGGVYVDSTAAFNMYGGEITDNCTIFWNSGGGIYNLGSCTISGSAKVYDNIIPDSEYKNILVSNLCLINKINVGDLDDDAYIGITSKNGQLNYSSGNFIDVNNSGKDIEYLLENNFFDDTGESHVHNYGTLIPEKPTATCAQPGMQAYYKCSVCNQYFNTSKKRVTYSSLVVTVPHTEVVDEAVEATCTTAGKTEGKHCSVCNTVITAPTVIPAKGHTEVTDPAVAATCTEDGKTSGKHCSVCNTVIIAPTVIPAKGHTEVVDPAVEPTCTDEGKTEGKHCSVCNTIITPPTTIPAKGHSYIKGETVAPTSENSGYTVYTCPDCGDSYHGDIVPAIGHNFEVLSVTPPTCTEKGYTTYVCTVDGDTYDSDFVDPLGHDYVETVVEATCEADGYTRHSCTRCDYYYDDNVQPALGHDWDDGVITKEATESEQGIKTYTCKNCNETREEIIPKIGHIHSYTSEVIAPTCTEQGYTLYTCTDNDDSYKDDYTDPLGHSYKLVCNIENGEVKAKLKCEACGNERAVTADEMTVTDGKDEAGNPTKTVTVTVEGNTYTQTVKAEDPDDPNDDGKKDGFPWWIIAIAAAVLLFFIILIIIIIKRRNSKDEDYYDDEYYDDDDEEDEDEEEEDDDEDY